MSHEIRTPMNAILGDTQILQADRQLSADQHRAVDSISQGGEHLRGLINDVLDISKIEAGLEEFHPGEGEVAFAVRNLGEDSYRFEIADTGPGIPEDRQAQIFEPFHQDEEGLLHGGTGLGLAIARRHVDIMGGELSVESGNDSGAKFFFTIHLPAIGVSRAADEAAAQEDSRWSRVAHLAGGRAMRALVVDDVETNRDLLQQVLVRVGVEVDVVDSGEHAIEQVAAVMPDIIFMDIRMPDGMDGIETMQHLVEEYGPAATKIVAVTASVFEHERQRYIDEGFDGFIDKPLRMEHVYACMAELLGVEYVFAEKVDDGDGPELSAISLPASLHEALLVAAASHSISELNRYIDEVEGLSETGRSLASYLRSLSRQYDMKALEQYLRGIDQV